MINLKKPELLAPAGDIEKLKIAITYGADAVYLGGEAYGLRAKAKNFTLPVMKEGIDFAHANGAKVYVTVNIFAHNEDFYGMEDYFKTVFSLGADGFLISDPGVFSLARETVPDAEIHISTQANNTNCRSADFWYKQGAKRIVLARELSLSEISEMREKLPEGLMLEAFIHGAMCISYSGRCLLSNYMTGRDSNKGECAHPCRWKYYLLEESRPGEYMPVFEDEHGTYIYNSKDLCMISHIPELLNAGIESFKIEGRMKTPFYVGTVTKAYREAIDDYFSDPALYESKKQYYLDEVSKASHREYTTGFYFGRPNGNEQVYENNSYIRSYSFIGIIKESSGSLATVIQKGKFEIGDEIEVLTASGSNFSFILEEMKNDAGERITSAPHPEQLVKINFPQDVHIYDMLRKKLK